MVALAIKRSGMALAIHLQNATTILNPSHVAEVHAVREQLVLRIHAQSELHAAGIIQLIDVLEEQVAAFALHQLQRLYFVEFVVVVGRGADRYQLYADTLVVQTVGVQFYLYLNLVAYIEVLQVF